MSASWEELQSLFVDGKLAELLANKFGGRYGHLYPMKDSDFIMSFGDAPKTPTAQQVAKAVTEYYVGLGYVVEDQDPGRATYFGAIISCGRHLSDCPAMSMIITVPYPHDGNRANLRASCERVG